MYLAVPDTIYPKLISNRLIQKSIERMHMKIIVVNLSSQTIEKWKK